MVVKWQFYDPVTTESYTFEINPSQGGSPQLSKNFAYQSTAAPDGKVIAFEGRIPVQTIEFSGTILSQSQYDAIIEWFNKPYQIQVTDDLGRSFVIVIEQFSPTRERAFHYPYKHSYTVRATIVDWP